jgi:hypothetical protein
MQFCRSSSSSAGETSLLTVGEAIFSLPAAVRWMAYWCVTVFIDCSYTAFNPCLITSFKEFVAVICAIETLSLKL